MRRKQILSKLYYLMKNRRNNERTFCDVFKFSPIEYIDIKDFAKLINTRNKIISDVQLILQTKES